MNCPVCQKGLEIADKHFGTLFSCPHCRAVFYIGWDGTPEVGHHEPDPVAEEGSPAEAPAADEEWRPSEDPAPWGGQTVERSPEPAAPEEPPAWTPPENPPEFAPVEPPPSEPSWSAPETPAAEFAPPAEVATEFAAVEEAPEAITETPMAEESAPEPYNFDQPLGAPSAPTVTDSGDFSEVTSYANSEAATGPISYLIVVRGLELADTFEKLREALTDSRFGWDVEEVMSRVRSGELTLKGLNPTKASILVSRIKYLPVELEWKQEVFSASP